MNSEQIVAQLSELRTRILQCLPVNADSNPRHFLNIVNAISKMGFEFYYIGGCRPIDFMHGRLGLDGLEDWN